MSSGGSRVVDIVSRRGSESRNHPAFRRTEIERFNVSSEVEISNQSEEKFGEYNMYADS